jgi:hypothetical protein
VHAKLFLLYFEVRKSRMQIFANKNGVKKGMKDGKKKNNK